MDDMEVTEGLCIEEVFMINLMGDMEIEVDMNMDMEVEIDITIITAHRTIVQNQECTIDTQWA